MVRSILFSNSTAASNDERKTPFAHDLLRETNERSPGEEEVSATQTPPLSGLSEIMPQEEHSERPSGREGVMITQISPFRRPSEVIPEEQLTCTFVSPNPSKKKFSDQNSTSGTSRPAPASTEILKAKGKYKSSTSKQQSSITAPVRGVEVSESMMRKATGGKDYVIAEHPMKRWVWHMSGGGHLSA